MAIVGANEEGGDTGHLTNICVLEQLLLLKPLDELGKDNATGVWQSTVPDKEAAALDGSGSAFRKKEGSSPKRRFTEHPQDGDPIFGGDRRAVISEPQLRTSSFGEHCTVEPGVIDGSVRWTAMKTFGDGNRRSNRAIPQAGRRQLNGDRKPI